ncbi:F-box only protein 4 isoform X2 [Ambystoma mexicanum]|uniref:F-box only protein 4 isoform X2 n=1 Tax=Ambystoma mexicanum TaxID=8296 RepID=UPI0037E7D69E
MVDMQLYIMSFISPRDLCQLGCTSNYWYLMVRDAVLWRYFLLRDLPSWSSIDWNSLPSADILKTSCSESNDGMLHDYMAIYLKSCPGSRKSLKSNRPMYGAVTSFLHSLVVNAEPRFAMFGPGLEQLDDSLVRSMMTSPELLPVAGFPQRQIDGIGSGVTFQCNNHKLNILTLYSTTSKERARARAGENAAVNKMFIPENITSENQHSVHYNIIPQVQEVCRVVDGFIYVANAEMHAKHERLEEIAHISAMTDPALGSPSRPFLMLSCISRAGIRRIPSIYMAHELCLDRLNRPWMVQDTDASALTGLLDGIKWILGESGTWI